MQNYYQREEEVSFEWSRLPWDQATQWGKRQKTQSNRKNIGERRRPSSSLADVVFFFFRPRRFSPPFSPDSSPVVSKLSLLISGVTQQNGRGKKTA